MDTFYLPEFRFASSRQTGMERSNRGELYVCEIVEYECRNANRNRYFITRPLNERKVTIRIGRSIGNVLDENGKVGTNDVAMTSLHGAHG